MQPDIGRRATPQADGSNRPTGPDESRQRPSRVMIHLRKASVFQGCFGTIGTTMAQVLIRAGAATTIPGIVAGTV